ncbi:response regulator [Streptomyces sp. HUCO-GS316]|uniref:LytR/AlgR family response regulator transcription factor n=1 Tax=Streptomyces sp. HUCO-GS316 TaxID=2692198 RepID=UPI00136F0D07|nr:LytTR family DNA-binding domain-containing protein [Streptomyces sp. HUCO-GS316]MXM64629.1 response regulator [Streptomyces sp. HUCO-GS316]
MLHVLAVDDEAPALEELAYLLRRDARVAEVRTATDGTQALLEIDRALGAGRPLDAVFLDIGMPDLDGVAIARLISRFARPLRLVFVTAHEDYAVDAFSLHAADYVLKPVDPERLAEAVRRIADETNEPTEEAAPEETAQATAPPADEVISVELGGVTCFVRRSEVLYAEAQGDYARLHASSGTHLVRTSLAALEERWRDAGFLRIHRGYLVAVTAVNEIRMEAGRTCVRLGDTVLPVSRRHVRQVRDVLVRHAFTRRPEAPPGSPPARSGGPSSTAQRPGRPSLPHRDGAR